MTKSGNANTALASVRSATWAFPVRAASAARTTTSPWWRRVLMCADSTYSDIAHLPCGALRSEVQQGPAIGVRPVGVGDAVPLDIGAQFFDC